MKITLKKDVDSIAFFGVKIKPPLAFAMGASLYFTEPPL